MKYTCWLLIIIVSIANTANAIVVRHDIADIEYQIKHNDYPYVAFISGGTGVVIAPQWILTAAHVAKYVTKNSHVITANNLSYVENIFIHPHTNLLAPHTWENDIALIRTTQPIHLPIYPKLYRKTDQEKRIVTFLGRGGTGNGKLGETREDGLLRKASNAIDAVEDSWLRFDFDPPSTGLKYEGISGTGDSGGPALIFQDDQAFVVGISSFQNTGHRNSGQYGVHEYYANIYTYMSWIDLILSASDHERAAHAYRVNNCPSKTITNKKLQDYVGEYEFDDQMVVEFIIKEDRLFRTNPERRLIYCGNDRFAYEIFDIEIEFSRNSNGSIEELTFKQWYLSNAKKVY